jgi:hypothetical protein
MVCPFIDSIYKIFCLRIAYKPMVSDLNQYRQGCDHETAHFQIHLGLGIPCGRIPSVVMRIDNTGHVTVIPAIQDWLYRTFTKSPELIRGAKILWDP